MAVTYTWKKYKVNQTVDRTIEWSTTTKTFTVKSIGYLICDSSAYAGDDGEYHMGFVSDSEINALMISNNTYPVYKDTYYSSRKYIKIPSPYHTQYWSGDIDPTYVYKVKSCTSNTLVVYTPSTKTTVTGESQGAYISDVTSTSSSAYPSNGKHTDGYWYVYQGNDNVAPTTPGVPSLPSEIKGGDSITVTWTASTDTNSNLSGYQLYVQLDGGSWTSVYKGSARSYNYTVPEGTETIAFRVRAYDALSAYSSYATSSTVAVNNTITAISGNVNIGGVKKALTGAGYVNINGVLKPLVDGYVNIGGVLKSLKPLLPNGYTQVEYIQSSGTQYINTGFKPNSNTRVVMDFELTSADSNCFIFGGRTSTSQNQYALCCYMDKNQFRSDFHTNQQTVSGTLIGRHTVDKNKNVCVVDDTTVTNTAGTFTGSYDMYLFTVNTAGTIFSPSFSGKIYSCQIYDNGTLIRDFVPCTNSSGVAGLYDLANGVFYGNSGSGSFTAGAAVA